MANLTNRQEPEPLEKKTGVESEPLGKKIRSRSRSPALIHPIYIRDAALMSFGSILEGPDPTQLKPLVEQALPMLIETLKDSSVVVKVRQ